jgi:hypothetical protein
MYFTPHRLYKVTDQSSQEDANGNPVAGLGETKEFLTRCFLHNIKYDIRRGYAGKGIDVNFYVNMDRRSDLNIGDFVEIRELDDITVREKGSIKDIRHTSGMLFASQSNYTIIYI